MEDTESNQTTRLNLLQAGAVKKINANGHGFQFAVSKFFEEKRKRMDSRWILVGTEVPVSLHNTNTHIDLVCRNADRVSEPCDYLIVECKRVDPARGNWCFFKNPYTWFNTDPAYLQFDELRYQESSDALIGSTNMRIDGRVYHLGYALSTQEKGEGQGTKGSAIDDAITQVLRGTSGFINQVGQDWQDTPKNQNRKVEHYRFLPLVITTADLFVSSADLTDTGLVDGKIDPTLVTLEPVDWIWFSYNRPNELNHKVGNRKLDENDYLNPLFYQFTRSVAIVNPKGLDYFLDSVGF